MHWMMATTGSAIASLLFAPLMLGAWEVVAIAAVVLLLFGGKKIPELMRGLGKGLRSFREGMDEVEREAGESSKKGDNPSGAGK